MRFVIVVSGQGPEPIAQVEDILKAAGFGVRTVGKWEPGDPWPGAPGPPRPPQPAPLEPKPIDPRVSRKARRLARATQA